MIEEYARVLAYVLGLKTDGRESEALRELRNGYSTYFNEEHDVIRALHPTQLLKRLLDHHGLNLGQIEIFAQGLRTEADLLLQHEPAEAKDRYIKALALYEYVEFTDTTSFSIPRRHAIEEIMYSISAL